METNKEELDGNENEMLEFAEKITKSALQRLLKRCGVRIIGDVFNIMRIIIKTFSSEIIRKMAVFMEISKRKTFQIEDLTSALRILNIDLVAGLNLNSKNIKNSLQSCKSIGKSGPEKKKTTHKVSHEIKTNRIINYYQKNSDCLAIPKSNFNFMIRNISSEFGENLRFSEGVIELLQLTVEDHIIKICKKAYECSIFANRDTLYTKDIELVLKIIDLPYSIE